MTQGLIWGSSQTWWRSGCWSSPDKPPLPFLSWARRAKAGYVQPNIDRNLDFMESELGQREWFAGPGFSAADVQMSFPLEAARARGGLDARRPRLMGFLERIHARPAYRRAIEKGGEYALLR